MERKERYIQKLGFILDKITNLPKKFDEDEFYLDALFYRMQISIDATMDVIAMLCKDLGITVTDDYGNLDELNKQKLFSKSLIEELKKWNGLRNAVVHKYNKIEEDLIKNEKDNVKKSLKDFIEKVEVIVNEKLFQAEEDQK